MSREGGAEGGGGRGCLGRALAGRAGVDLFAGGGVGPLGGARRVVAAPLSFLPPRGPWASRPPAGALKGGMGGLAGAFGAHVFFQKHSVREGVRAVPALCARLPNSKNSPWAATGGKGL